MGDWSRWIADAEAVSGEAPRLARRVLDRLVEREIVRPERTDCVLGDAGGGHAPGPAYRDAVAETYDGFLDRWPNGLEIDIGRVAYFGSPDERAWRAVSALGGRAGPSPHGRYRPVAEDDRVTCPRCQAWMPFGMLMPVVEEWEDGGPNSPACPGCGGHTALDDWGWPGPCAFAVLGFRFWNWPPLTPGFMAAVSDLLGHRTVTGTSGAGISY